MSGRKSNLKQYQVITNGNMTGTNTITSSVTSIEFLDNIGFQFDWTGSPTGTFQVQVSANYNQDINGNVLNPGTWVPATLTYWNGSGMVVAVSIPTSAGTPVYVDCTQFSAPWVRCQYTNIAGSGILTATIVAKMI